MRHVLSVCLIAVVALALTGAENPSADDSLDLTEYQGKVVVLDFWASWCAPCRESFPWWNTMHAKYVDEGLVIIGVNLDNEPDAAHAFLEEYPASFKIYYDTEKELAQEFGVQAMPSSYIIGRNGEIFAKHFGFKDKKRDEYEAVIVAALRAAEQ